MVKITVNLPVDKLQKLMDALSPAGVDPVSERIALRTLGEVIQSTPQRWFGQVRKSWQMQKPREGARLIVNDNKIMLFLEKGTRDHGPVTAKALYIPLTRAASFGYKPGMKWGVDFVLAKRVRGIQARYIAKFQAIKATVYAKEAMKEHIRQAIS